MRHLTIALVSVLITTATPAVVMARSTTIDEPIGFGGRVEVPEAGYALTVPDDWFFVHPSDDEVDVILDGVSSIVPDLAPMIEGALAGGLGFSLLAFGPGADTSFTQNCNVLDRPSEGESIDAIGTTEIAKLGGLGDLIAKEPELTFIDLPSGRAARLDLSLRLPEFETASTSYLLTDGVWVHTLTCTDLVRPDDAWLSIAETFESLPSTGG